jgi:hypothetical protein
VRDSTATVNAHDEQVANMWRDLFPTTDSTPEKFLLPADIPFESEWREKYIGRNLEFQDHLVTESGGDRGQFRLNDVENEMNSEKFRFQSCIQESYPPSFCSILWWFCFYSYPTTPLFCRHCPLQPSFASCHRNNSPVWAPGSISRTT